MKKVLLVTLLFGGDMAMAACQTNGPVADSPAATGAGTGGGGGTGGGDKAEDPTGAAAAGTDQGKAPECKKAGLDVSLNDGGAASGHRGFVVVFRNNGGSSCRLRAYPGVAALDAAGTQVAQAKRTPHGFLGGLPDGAPIPTVTLVPGASASALIEGTAFNTSDGSACTAYKAFLVTTPNDTVSTPLGVDTDMCANLEIHPVVAGMTGRQ